MDEMIASCTGFEWDDWNRDKNWYLHEVTNSECEEIFFNVPLIVAADSKHSQQEQRYYALGQTDRGRWLFAAFTIRNGLIWVISARDMNEREMRKYDDRVQRYAKL
jgi:uncharacterized DUF497 family protein